MAKKIVDTQKFLRKVRNKFYEDTKNMTTKEKFDYISKESDRGKKRIDSAIEKIKQKESRGCQVLIRLTESERSQLETDAKQEKITLSSLIRRRALREQNHLNTIIKYLEKIESKLSIK
jgi:hypothetical protein